MQIPWQPGKVDTVFKVSGKDMNFFIWDAGGQYGSILESKDY